jgi:methionyl aminopeptidase
MYNKVKTPAEIAAIRKSGEMLAKVLRKIEEVIQPGMTGIDIDTLARNELSALGGVPAFLGYQGFPNSICISVNDAVVHGIPNDTKFKSGDIVGFDFGVIYEVDF